VWDIEAARAQAVIAYQQPAVAVECSPHSLPGGSHDEAIFHRLQRGAAQYRRPQERAAIRRLRSSTRKSKLPTGIAPIITPTGLASRLSMMASTKLCRQTK